MSCEAFAQIDAFTVGLLVVTVWNAAAISVFSFLMMDIRRPASVMSLFFSVTSAVVLIALTVLVTIGLCQ